jgi:hypothetical protein
MTSPTKSKDLDDVRALIKALKLDASYAENLNEYVREKFEELRSAAE